MTRNHDRNLRELILETIETISDQYLCQLLIDTYRRYEYHLSIARKNHVFFRNIHYVLSFLIPIYSAFFTYIVSNDFSQSPRILGAMGLFLTILTIVASILKPYERCISAGEILIVLSEWKTDLMINLGNVQPDLDTNAKNNLLYEFLNKKDRELSEIGTAMMENLILKSSANLQQNTNKDEQRSPIEHKKENTPPEVN